MITPEAWLSTTHTHAATLAQSQGNKGSPPAFVFVIFGAIIIALILAGILAKRADDKRRQAVRALLENRGFAFHAAGAAAETAYDEALAPIQALASRPEKTRWSASGEIAGVELMALEHQYSTGSGKSRQVHNHSVISIPVPRSWPKLDIDAENLFHKIGALFGSKDLKVEDEAFNKRFRIKGESEDFALLFLTPEVQSLLLQWPKRTTLAVGHGRLCITRAAHLSPDLWPALLEDAVALRKALPDELDAWA